MNKLLDQFNALNDRARYGIFAAVVVVAVALDVFFLMAAQVAAIGRLHTDIQKLSGEIRQVTADRQRITQLRKNLQDDRNQLDVLNARVRPIQEIPAILSSISSTANEYNVKIDEMVPEKTQQEVLASNPEAKYYAVPIVIKAHCGYHAFGHFLNKLETGNMCFLMKEFIIQNDSKDPNIQLYSLIIKLVLADKH